MVSTTAAVIIIPAIAPIVVISAVASVVVIPTVTTAIVIPTVTTAIITPAAATRARFPLLLVNSGQNAQVNAQAVFKVGVVSVEGGGIELVKTKEIIRFGVAYA